MLLWTSNDRCSGALTALHPWSCRGGGGGGGGDTRDSNLSKTTKKVSQKTRARNFSVYFLRRSFSFSLSRRALRQEEQEARADRRAWVAVPPPRLLFQLAPDKLCRTFSRDSTQKNMNGRKTKKNPLLSLGSTCLTLQLALGYIHRAPPRPLIHRPSTQGHRGTEAALRGKEAESRERRGTRPPATKSYSTLRVGPSQGREEC